MKKAIIYSVFVLGFLTFTVLPSTGQITSAEEKSNTNFKLTRKVALTQDSEITEIKINCKENMDHFSISIAGIVYKGNLKIEILNPKGRKIDSFDIESHLSKDIKSQSVTEWEKNKVFGEIRKSFDNPLPGKWIVKIIPDSVFGDVNILSTSDYHTN